MNITLEKIQERLKAERDKLTLGKQVSDKWIENRATRLSKLVTEEMEETEIDNLVADSIEDMQEVQANINTVMAAEAAKKPKPKPSLKPVEKPKEDEPVKTEIELPDDVKEMLEYYKQQKQTSAITAKRDAIFNAAKGLSETQKTAFKEYINDMNPDMEADANELATAYVAKFTKLFTAVVGNDTGTAAANGASENKSPNVDFYKSIGQQLKTKNC